MKVRVTTNQQSAIGNSKKVVIGLSGGVDSSLAAALLIEHGYEVTGVFLECWEATQPGCQVDQDRKDALNVALRLDIPFKVLDFKQAYQDRVLDYFFSEYRAGRTPNPDTMCNREIKFGLFYEWAQVHGFDYVATGHYARITHIQDSRFKNQAYFLQRSVDTKKDQTYFLYQLQTDQLPKILFPIGHMTKHQVRVEADKRQIQTANKPDSQGICFIGSINVNQFLKDRIQPKLGQVVNQSGETIGVHEGVWFYTIGQRGGWTVLPEYQQQFQGEIPVYYVTDKNVDSNQLVVGEADNLLRDTFMVEQINWLIDSKSLITTSRDLNCYVRIRNTGELVAAKLEINDRSVNVVTRKPMRSIAPGQACVFYSDDSNQALVLGGGIIGD